MTLVQAFALRASIARRRAHVVRMHAIEGCTPYVRQLLAYQSRDVSRLAAAIANGLEL